MSQGDQASELDPVHAAIIRALSETGVKPDVLIGMYIDVGLKAYSVPRTSQRGSEVMSDVNKNYLRGKIIALEVNVAHLEAEVTKWKEAYDDAHAALEATQSQRSPWSMSESELIQEIIRLLNCRASQSSGEAKS